MDAGVLKPVTLNNIPHTSASLFPRMRADGKQLLIWDCRRFNASLPVAPRSFSMPLFNHLRLQLTRARLCCAPMYFYKADFRNYYHSLVLERTLTCTALVSSDAHPRGILTNFVTNRAVFGGTYEPVTGQAITCGVYLAACRGVAHMPLVPNPPLVHLDDTLAYHHVPSYISIP